MRPDSRSSWILVVKRIMIKNIMRFDAQSDSQSYAPTTQSSWCLILGESPLLKPIHCSLHCSSDIFARNSCECLSTPATKSLRFVSRKNHRCMFEKYETLGSISPQHTVAPTDEIDIQSSLSISGNSCSF